MDIIEIIIGTSIIYCGSVLIYSIFRILETTTLWGGLLNGFSE